MVMQFQFRTCLTDFPALILKKKLTCTQFGRSLCDRPEPATNNFSASGLLACIKWQKDSRLIWNCHIIGHLSQSITGAGPNQWGGFLPHPFISESHTSLVSCPDPTHSHEENSSSNFWGLVQNSGKPIRIVLCDD